MLRFETAGESHGECLLATLTGLPAGVPVSIDAVNRELAAIDAYEAAKSSKPLTTAKKARTPRSPAQGRRGSKRDALMQTIRQNPDGLTRAEILEKMGLKGDNSGEMSISNALTALTKANQVSRRDGKYTSA